MCARVGNQQSHGVMIARLRSSIRSLLHQCRDLHQLTYLYLAEDQEPTSHQQHRLSHIGYPSCRLKLTCVEDRFQKDTKTWPAGQGVGPVGPTLGRLGPGFVPRRLPVSYYLRLVLDIMKICMNFGPYNAFPSFDVSEIVDQQNSWNSLVICTYLLYLA
jgi:hypothetical protein